MSKCSSFQKVNCYFVLLTGAFILFSCGGPPKTKLLVRPIWKFNDITSTSSDSTVLSALVQNRNFLNGQELKFNSDLTFTSSFPESNNAELNSGGDWAIDSVENKITLLTYESKSTWDIQTLNENTFEMKRFDVNLNADLYYRYKKK